MAPKLLITRVFDAPRERVWQAWTDPALANQWEGPAGFTVPAAEMDVRVGGKYLLAMRSPEGQDVWSTGTYLEIREPELMVSTDSFADEKGNVIPASHYGMSADFPLELRVTVTFEKHDGKTKMVLSHEGFPSTEDADLARTGWNESFDKLERLLQK